MEEGRKGAEESARRIKKVRMERVVKKGGERAKQEESERGRERNRERNTPRRVQKKRFSRQERQTPGRKRKRRAANEKSQPKLVPLGHNPHQFRFSSSEIITENCRIMVILEPLSFVDYVLFSRNIIPILFFFIMFKYFVVGTTKVVYITQMNEKSPIHRAIVSFLLSSSGVKSIGQRSRYILDRSVLSDCLLFCVCIKVEFSDPEMQNRCTCC